MIALWGWQRISLASLVSAAACGFTLGGLASVCLSQRFLTQFITANSNDGTFAINGSAAFDWEDGLCAHIVAYVGAFLVACCAVLFAFLMRDPAQPAPPSKRGIAAIIMPFGATVFGIAALGGGIIDRTMTKQLFDPSYVTASRVLEPFYAYDAPHQRVTLALIAALMLVWLGWALLWRSTGGHLQAA